MQFVNKKILHKLISGKKIQKKKEKTKNIPLLENNQPEVSF